VFYEISKLKSLVLTGKLSLSCEPAIATPSKFPRKKTLSLKILSKEE